MCPWFFLSSKVLFAYEVVVWLISSICLFVQVHVSCLTSPFSLSDTNLAVLASPLLNAIQTHLTSWGGPQLQTELWRSHHWAGKSLASACLHFLAISSWSRLHSKAEKAASGRTSWACLNLLSSEFYIVLLQSTCAVKVYHSGTASSFKMI